MRPLLLPVLFSLLAVHPAMAQEKISFPAAGETMLNLAATEHSIITQDLLTASLRIEKDNADAVALQAAINQTMKEVLEITKAAANVKTSTGHYYVYQFTPQHPAPLHQPDMPEQAPPAPLWKGSQSLTLQATDAQALLELAGQLQKKGMVIDNLSYSLSPEKTEEAKDSLMEAAIAKVKAKADRAAKALGKNNATLIEITVDAHDMPSHQPVMMRAMAMDGAMEKMEAPSAEPGETTISLTVSARAVLK